METSGKKEIEIRRKGMEVRKNILDKMKCQEHNKGVEYKISNDWVVKYTTCCNEFGEEVERSLDLLPGLRDTLRKEFPD